MSEPVVVIVNKSGGTASALGDKLEATVREAFAGQEIELHLIEGHELAEAVRSVGQRSERVRRRSAAGESVVSSTTTASVGISVHGSTGWRKAAYRLDAKSPIATTSSSATSRWSGLRVDGR